MSYDVEPVLKIRGRQGTFKVMGQNKDGSFCLYGGIKGREMYCDAQPEDLIPHAVGNRRKKNDTRDRETE